MATPEYTQLLAKVGLAISTWSRVERALTLLFTRVSDMDEGKAIAMFDCIIALEIRLALVNKLMSLEVGMSDLDKEMWVRCARQIIKLYKKRHQLAHFGLTKNNGVWSISPFLTADAMLADTRTFLTIKNVDERNVQFEQLATAIGWFTNQASRRRLPKLRPPREYEEPDLVPRLRELASLTLEERTRRGPPPPPDDELD